MQALKVLAVFFGGGYYVQSAGTRVDDRRGGDADLRIDHLRAYVRARNGSDPLRRIDETVLPERVYIVAAVIVRIEGVHAVVLGGDVDHIVLAFTRYGHILEFDGLRVDLTIHRLTEQLAEGGGVHVRGSERALLEVLPGAQVVVVVGDNVDLTGGYRCQCLQEKNVAKRPGGTRLHSCYGYY